MQNVFHYKKDKLRAYSRLTKYRALPIMYPGFKCMGTAVNYFIYPMR